MPFPEDTYSPARVMIINAFAEKYDMQETDLDDANGEKFLLESPPVNYQADFFVLKSESCMINNFGKEKPMLTKADLENFMELLMIKKLLVPVVVNDEHDQWAIAVYEKIENTFTLTYYSLNGNFLPQQIADAFCEVMSCKEDVFFITVTNYHPIDIGYVEQENNSTVQIWGALKGLITGSLNQENPWLHTALVKTELEEYQATTETNIMLLEPDIIHHQNEDEFIPNDNEFDLMDIEVPLPASAISPRPL